MTSTQPTLIRKAVAAVIALAVIASGLALMRQASASSALTLAAQNDQPQIGPGVPLVGSNASKSAISNTKAGSVLFFHKYTSDNANPSGVNTLISLTNVNPRDAAKVRVFFVRDCTVASQFINLAANQTSTLLASAVDPGKKGYIVAVAVDSQGNPSQFNWLIGNASLRDAEGHEASYNAVGVAKRSAGPVASVVGTVAEMKFDDAEYDRLPQLNALDNIQSQDVAGSRTDVFVYSPLSDLTGAPAPATRITATSYEQNGTAHPTVVDIPCALSTSVGAVWTSPPLNSYITPSNPGWATFAATTVDNIPVPLLGLSLTDGASTPQHNARSMQVLSRLDTFSMKLSITAPPNPDGDPLTANQPDAPGGGLGAGELKAGSALVYHRFTTGTFGQSRINITNTHPTQSIRLRLFFNGLADESPAKDTFTNLLPNQTKTIDPAQFALNQKGWIVALALDSQSKPTNFNFLIGSAQVREQNGASSGYNALAIAKNSPGAVPRNPDGETTDLLFNDAQYDRMPSTVGLAGLHSQTDNTTRVGYERLPASFLDPANIRGSVPATAYDASGAAFSATVGPIETNIGTVRPNNNPQLPPITSTIAAGSRGWLKLSLLTPIFGWSANTPNQPFSAAGAIWNGGFNGGATFYLLSAASSATLNTPAVDPNNQPPTANFATIDFRQEARALNGTIVRLDGRSSSDPNNDQLSYKWSDGDNLITTQPVSDFRLALGSHTIKLIVTDTAGVESEPRITEVEVRDTTRPIMSGVPTNITKITSSSVGATISFTNAVAYDMVDGFLNVTASKASGSVFPIGRTVVTFTARDFSGNQTTANMEVNVIQGAADSPAVGGIPRNKTPIMNNINDRYVLVSKTTTFSLQAIDPDNDPVTFTVLGGPAFARIEGVDPGNRRATLVIAPQPGDPVTTSNVRVVASDNKGGIFTTLPFKIVISDFETDDTGSGGPPPNPNPSPTPTPGPGDNRPPVAVAAPLASPIQATSKFGASVHLDGSQSSDPDNNPLTYSWKDNGVEIATTAVADVFLAIGQHSITLTVSDGKGGTNTTAAQAVEVTPRPLTVARVSPSGIRVFSIANLTVIGTGFTPGTQVRFDCSAFTSCGTGGSQITVTINKIEEDTIFLTAKTTQSTPQGNRDVVVTSPDGTTVKLLRGVAVSP